MTAAENFCHSINSIESVSSHSSIANLFNLLSLCNSEFRSFLAGLLPIHRIELFPLISRLSNLFSNFRLCLDEFVQVSGYLRHISPFQDPESINVLETITNGDLFNSINNDSFFPCFAAFSLGRYIRRSLVFSSCRREYGSRPLWHVTERGQELPSASEVRDVRER